MAGSQFFAYDPFYEYDPYDYFTASPYDYAYYPYYTRRSRSFFAGAEPEAVTAAAKPNSKSSAKKTQSFSIPVHGPDSDAEPGRNLEPKSRSRASKTESFSVPVHGPDSAREPERKREAAPAKSAEEAALRMQAAARGLLARKSVRAVREVERQASVVREAVALEEAALRGDASARIALGEALMGMLLRLDGVRGARSYRRRVTRRVLALQDAVDSLAPPAPVAEEEGAVEPYLPDAMEHGSEMESKAAAETSTQVEVDEAVGATAGEPEAAAQEQREAAPVEANVDANDLQDLDAEEWEMVTGSHAAPAAATPHELEAPRQEPACPSETTRTAIASAGSISDGIDVRKVVEMVATLCEQSMQQFALISALAERVDALERSLRQMEDTQKN